MRRLFSKSKSNLRKIRHARIRATVIGTSAAPRLCVFRGNRAMTAQIIDDSKGITMCACASREIKDKKAEGKKAKVADGFLIGQLLAEKAKAKGVTKVVFDRGGYKYHGRVAALAEGARAGGLQF
ncbi:MAG: 50S ribosomal protein L18 [bacterium]